MLACVGFFPLTFDLLPGRLRNREYDDVTGFLNKYPAPLKNIYIKYVCVCIYIYTHATFLNILESGCFGAIGKKESSALCFVDYFFVFKCLPPGYTKVGDEVKETWD